MSFDAVPPGGGAVLFDLDGTLIEGRSAFAAALHAVCRELSDGDEPAATLAARVLAEARDLWWNAPGNSHWRHCGVGSSTAPLLGDGRGCHDSCVPLAGWLPSYPGQVWSRALGVPVDHGSVSTAARRLVEEVRNRVTPYADTVPTLVGLRRAGWTTCIVTNGLPVVQLDRIRQAGLGALVDHVVVSGAVGVGKPRARIFELAVEHVGAPRDRVVMVGDHLDRDVRGALDAGLAAIWCNRDGLGASAPGDVSSEKEPVVEVQDLADVVKFLPMR